MKSRPIRCVVSAIGLLAALGCDAHVAGRLAVDGAPFKPVQCRSGAAYHGTGVEIADAAGRRLRVGESFDGSANVILLRPGADSGDRVGPCGLMTVEPQESRVNGIVNVGGTANLFCDHGGHQVFGYVSFENCH